MAGDDDLKSSVPEEDDDGDPYFENLLNVIMASPNPSLLDMTFNDNPSPLALPTPTMDVNDETQFMNEFNLPFTNCGSSDDFDVLSFIDDDYIISLDMFELPNDDCNDNINSDVPREVANDDRNDNINNDVPVEIGYDNGNHNGGETNRLEVSTRVFGDINGPNFEIGGTSTMPVPVTRPISNEDIPCDCCSVLREIVHTNCFESKTLAIRGGIGFFCHANLEVRPFVGASPSECKQQTFHLKDLTMEDVKNFIEYYCWQTVKGGFYLVVDTNAAFYQAMNANTIHSQSQTLTNSSYEDVPVSLVMPDQGLNVLPAPPNVGLIEGPTTGLPKERPRRQTPLAAQRERTGKLTLSDISMHFHLPIEVAAKEMNLCPTVLKKICRKGGLMRWPHRKIKSLQKKITLLRSMLPTAKNEEARANTEAEIDSLLKEIDDICSDALKNAK